MADNFEELKAQLNDPQNRSVTDDMLARLESKLPPGAFGKPLATPHIADPMSNPFIMSQKIRQMEEQTRALAEKIAEIAAGNKTVTTDPSNMMVGTQDAMKAACDALEAIVATFNTALVDWYKNTGCVANFSWKYDPCKLLEVAGIDVIVYRKSAPTALTIKEALDNAPTV